jgi:hypothetical protein
MGPTGGIYRDRIVWMLGALALDDHLTNADVLESLSGQAGGIATVYKS